ncbi:MAG: hypothetical protein WCH44_04355 [Betaproteobacteria bacterium]
MQRRHFSFAPGWGWASALTQDRILLAPSAAFTGPAAQLGVRFDQGAKVFIDQVNARGGVNRHTLDMRKLDDGHEPEPAWFAP